MSFNCLHVSTADGDLVIQFKWGWQEHIHYRFGDTVLWYGMPRPEGAEGRIEIGGVSDEDSTPNELGFSNLFKIVICNDVIVGVERIDEIGFSSLR